MKIYTLLAFFLINPTFASRFDHFNIVVKNLDEAVSSFEAKGFKVKPGRNHGGEFVNAFIKFKDNSYIEFIQVKVASDALSKYFHKILIERGETAVFIAFEKKSLMKTPGMILDTGKFFSTLSYPLDHAMKSFFLIDYHLSSDDSVYFEHVNGVEGIQGIIIDAVSDLDQQFLPLDPRIGFTSNSDGHLVEKVTFKVKCGSKLEKFSKYGIIFTTSGCI